jgi:cobalamin biosynthesis protein CobW
MKIPTTVITGFLGSGKTTLIRQLLQNTERKRIALIINEFGDLGVDGDILKGCGDETCTEEDIMELSNGCICCTVAEDFIPTLTKLLEREVKPDHIVIETSGLALPQPLIRAFNWPEISTQVTVDSVITVVDGDAANKGQFSSNLEAIEKQRLNDENLDHETPISELFEDQLTCADLIIINKSDLISVAEIDALKTKLGSKTRKGVKIIQSTMGNVPSKVLLGQNVNAEKDIQSRHEIHHDHHHHDHHHDDHHHDDHHHDDFESFIVNLPEITDQKEFLKRMEGVIVNHSILRLKGFASIEGKPLRMTIQAVGPRIETYFENSKSENNAHETQLVVIGSSGLDKDAISSSLAG